ncbi:FIST signal transduction protein [Modestobacter versicolor]|uniref:FIST signal transduction protein n=1 Tax=Modestobacter versicolor TaxID=429133 RepID=UPI0034DEEB2F
MSTLLHGTGSSDAPAATDAGRAAATAAVAGLPGAPDLVVVFTSVRYDLPELLAGIRSVTGDAPLVGATSVGHFVGPDVTGPGQGVAVLTLSGGGYRFGVGSARGMSSRPTEAGVELVREARAAAGDHGLPHAALLLLTDGLVGGQQSVVAGAHRAAGSSVPIVGGVAADDWQLSSTKVLLGDEALSDAAVGVWIASPHPLRVATAHGWTPVGPPLLVTRAEGLVLHELGGQSAGEVFAEATGLAEAQQQGIADTVVESSYALGLIQPDGSHLVRAVFSGPCGELNTFEPVPTFAAVQVMSAEQSTLLAVVDDVAAGTVVTGSERVLLTFDCAARQTLLGELVAEEVDRLQREAGRATVFGLYTYGEFSRSRGAGGVHNATLTAIAL